MDPPVLSGHNFRLEPLREQQISDRYIGWLNNPEINRYLEVRFIHQTRETVAEYVRLFYGESEKYIWAIFSQESEQFIGTATLSLVSRIHGSGGIGFMIGERDYWGSGASEESLKLLIDFAFDQLGLRRLFAESCAPNHGMNFTFKKLGFSLEGKMRKGHYLSPGSYVDGYRWGILASEWREPQAR
jgi:RimJ/RimL family protein N-acetyltransferase